jgi:putative FmdB family regulatory protein
VPQAAGWSHVQPISTDRCSGRSARNLVDPTTFSELIVTSGISVPALAASSASRTNALHSSRVCGWTTLSHRQVRGSRDASQRRSSCSAASGSRLTIRPTSVGAFHASTVRDTTIRLVPIYEYACMECESHFEELVRSTDQAVTCPECGAAKVLKQLSSFAVHGVASKPAFSGPAGGGGGCCGGSCGCG